MTRLRKTFAVSRNPEQFLEAIVYFRDEKRHYPKNSDQFCRCWPVTKHPRSVYEAIPVIKGKPPGLSCGPEHHEAGQLSVASPVTDSMPRTGPEPEPEPEPESEPEPAADSGRIC